MSDRRAERHEATRQKILEVAWQLASERGLTGWSLREVASAVGMRAPSLYVYFDGKDAIYDAMFAQGYRQLLARIDAVPAPSDPAAALRRAAHEFVDFYVADSARHQLMFQRAIPSFTPSAESYALSRRTIERLRELLAAIGLDRDEAVDLWTALVTGLASQQASNEPGGDRWIRLIDRAVDMFLASEQAAAR